MTDIPIALDNSQLLNNNNNLNSSNHHNHNHNHNHHHHHLLKQNSLQTTVPKSSTSFSEQQHQQPFPNLETKKSGLIYIKNSQSLKNGTKISNKVPRSNSSSGNGGLSSNTSSVDAKSSTAALGRKRSNSQSQVVSIPTKPKYTTASTSRDPSKGGGSLLLSLTSRISSNPSSNNGSLSNHNPQKRNQIQYYVTLLPLNDTFIKKHLPVATYPETTKLGRPTGTKFKPDVTNGYFDSRVLSRNHAQIYIDPKNGKLMIQDLGSSNGTYLNEVKLSQDPTEIKIGDMICLGFNVQAESTHKQISLRIENLNVISTQLEGGNNYNYNNNNSDINGNGNFFINGNDQLDTPEFKRLSFIEDIARQVEKIDFENDDDNSTELKNKDHDHDRDRDRDHENTLTFDNALFSDINPNIEDNLLGLYSMTNSGIYNNSQITSTTTLENIINVLVLNLSRVKQQNSSLNSLSTFLENYYYNLNQLNQDYLDQQFQKKLLKIEQELIKEQTNHQKLKDKFKNLELESNKKLDLLNRKFKSMEKDRDNLKKSHIELQLKYETIENDYNLANETIESLKQEKLDLQEALDEMTRQQQQQQQQQQQEKEAKEREVLKLNGNKSKELLNDELVVSEAINGFIQDLSRTPSVRDNMKNLESSGTINRDTIKLTPPVSDNEEEEGGGGGEEDNDDEGISLPSTPSVLQRNGFKIEHSQKEKRSNGDDESIDSNFNSHSHSQQQQQHNDKSISPIITDFESIIATNSIPINSPEKNFQQQQHQEIEPFPKVENQSCNGLPIKKSITNQSNNNTKLLGDKGNHNNLLKKLFLNQQGGESSSSSSSSLMKILDKIEIEIDKQKLQTAIIAMSAMIIGYYLQRLTN